jgi:hypothetical protein
MNALNGYVRFSKGFFAVAITAAILVCGCNDSDSPEAVLPGNRALPSCPPGTASHRYVAFGGRCWEVRKTSRPEGPGLNRFSNDERNVWVDGSGRLHMKIAYRDGQWLCSEIMSEGGIGYGVYTFYVSGDATLFDPNVVLGLFTWDPGTLARGFLSEIDVELAKWGKTTDYTLHHSVQPIYGPDSLLGRYPERYATYVVPPGAVRTAHVFTWTPQFVKFASYSGWDLNAANLIASWDLTSDNPPRSADGYSTPVVIPAPTATTSVRINLWLYGSTGDDGLGDPPTDGREFEVVVDGFSYRPL